jgi:3',5'-cyclic AMP phosphodiesterase CpdA
VRLRLPMVILVTLGLTPLGAPASAVPVDTTVRTIRDTDGDDRLEFAPGEDHIVIGADPDFVPPDASIINFLQLSDFQIVDEESPARVEFLDTTQRGIFNPFSAAYRPQESLTTQVAEAMVRAARNTRSPITSDLLDLTILTGDNADSQQYNETRWFIDILDGHTFVNPDSGIPTSDCPDPTPGTVYDGVQGGGQLLGYYDPDASGPDADGDGYSPNKGENAGETGRPVTVRDFPGLFEAANQPFMALGVDMPWYTAFGNHDALVQGNSPYAYSGPFGASGELWGPDPQNNAYHEIATGCVKVSNATTSVFTDPLPDVTDPLSTVVVPPDARRCFLAKDDPTSSPPDSPCFESSWVEEHFATTGTPLGHGLAPAPCEPDPLLLDPEECAGYGRPLEAILNHDGYYSFSPVPGLRFAVLDSVTDECGTLFCSEGSIDDAQFQWLEEQILLAQLSSEYVMVFSHHSLATTRWPSTDPTEEPIHYGRRIDREDPSDPQNPIGGESLEELYCRSPNLLAHIDGHEHENFVEHYDCTLPEPIGSLGEHDFWEISTAAHIDWPQQARMIELIDNGDGTMSLVLTILDHAGPPDPGGAPPDFTANGASGQQVLRLASIARELAYNDYQGDRGALGGSEDRNVILIIPEPWPYQAT